MERNLLSNEVSALSYAPDIIAGEQEVTELNASYGTIYYKDISGGKLRFPNSGIFVPRYLKPESTQINLIIYFHGLIISACSGNPATYQKLGMKSYLENNQFFENLCADIADTNKNVLFIALTNMLDSKGKYQPSYRYQINSEVFNATVKESLDILKGLQLISPDAEVNNIIIAGHSAGGSPMQTIIATRNAKRTGDTDYVKKVKECWGFDSQYTGDTSPWVSWLKNNPSCIYRHVSGGTPLPGGGDMKIAKLKEKNPKGTVPPYMYISNLWHALGRIKSIDKNSFQFLNGQTSHCNMVNKFMKQFVDLSPNL